MPPLFARTTFDDYDYCADDAWLDEAFAVDESLDGIHGLVGATAQPARIPLDRILRPMTLEGHTKDQAGWQTRGAPVMGSVQGVLNHWDAATPSILRPDPSLKICTTGRPAGKGVTAVNGPLCNTYLGTKYLWLVASGRANHPGVGHQPLLNELRANILPNKTAKQRGLHDTGGSGATFAGIEVAAPGNGTPITWHQWNLLVDHGACFAAWYDWHPNRVAWHHALWTPRKIDYTPGRMPPWKSAEQYRDAVAARIAWAKAGQIR